MGVGDFIAGELFTFATLARRSTPLHVSRRAEPPYRMPLAAS